jgi:hypothetical protein
VHNMTAATDQLAAAARDNMPTAIDDARRLLHASPSRDVALATLTARMMRTPSSGVAAIAADALLRLAEVDQ